MTVHPSCYRSQAKRDRTPTPEQFKQWWMKAYTSDEIIEKIRTLPDEKYLDGWFKFLPKEVKVDSTSTFVLQINGLQSKPIKALDTTTTHQLGANDDDLDNNNNTNVIDIDNVE